MQTAPKGGSGLRTRPSRERVGARSAGRGDPVFAVWFARWRRRPSPGSPGYLVRQGRTDRMEAAGGDDTDGRGFGPCTASSMEHFPREFPPRKVKRALGHAQPPQGVAMGRSPRSAWSRVPQSSGPGRSECDVFAGWQQLANHTRRPERNRNPTSGSGPRDRNVAGEQPVEGVRNSEDGTCRVRQARVERTLLPMSLKGRQTPRGEPETVTVLLATGRLVQISGRR